MGRWTERSAEPGSVSLWGLVVESGVSENPLGSVEEVRAQTRSKNKQPVNGCFGKGDIRFYCANVD